MAGNRASIKMNNFPLIMSVRAMEKVDFSNIQTLAYSTLDMHQYTFFFGCSGITCIQCA